MSNKKMITEQELRDDFNEVLEKFKKEKPEIPVFKITRDFFTKFSKYRRAYERFYNSNFSDFKKAMFKDEEKEKEKVKSYEKEKRIVTLEDENRALKRTNKDLLKTSVHDDAILDLYKTHLSNTKRKLNINNTVIKQNSKKHAILNLSDWHIGEVVTPEEVNGVNKYNKDIFIKRADTVFNNFVGYCQNIGIKECTLNFLGDLLTGNIHQELESTNDLGVIEALFFLETYLSTKLEWLSQHFNSININFLSGNHGRIASPNSNKPFFKKKAINNWEYVLANHLKQLLEVSNNKKITMNIPKSPFMTDTINGTVFLLHHGDTISGGNSFGGLPYGGFVASSAKLHGSLNIAEGIHFDNVIIGHFHTSASIPLTNGGQMWVNASLIGASEFSLMKIKRVSKVQQLLLIIKENGEIDGEINIGV